MVAVGAAAKVAARKTPASRQAAAELARTAAYVNDSILGAHHAARLARLVVVRPLLIADLIRDVFGNPFRPLSIAPAWLAWSGGLVVRLARAAYDNRQLPAGTLEPDRLAILADALEEAGADAELVGHLRGPGPHWRGCCCIDALTGRE